MNYITEKEVEWAKAFAKSKEFENIALLIKRVLDDARNPDNYLNREDMINVGAEVKAIAILADKFVNLLTEIKDINKVLKTKKVNKSIK